METTDVTENSIKVKQFMEVDFLNYLNENAFAEPQNCIPPIEEWDKFIDMDKMKNAVCEYLEEYLKMME